MANLVEFFFNTEAKILALTPEDAQWVDRAFYYIDGVPYFYELVNGAMEKKGYSDPTIEGVGVTLNGLIIGGIKNLIEIEDILNIPINYEYNTMRLQVDGIINNDGQINIMN